MKLKKALIDFESHQERRLSSLRAQLGQQQDDMISKINLLWKAVSEKRDDMPTRNIAGNPTDQMNFACTDYPKKKNFEERGSKAHQNEAKESMKSSATEYKDHKMTVESKEEFEEETDEETEEEEDEDNPEHFDVFPTMKELGYHEWLLKNPRPHG
ncbi:hypothetical protein Tco_0152430 [Tanacetum coccineum]